MNTASTVDDTAYRCAKLRSQLREITTQKRLKKCALCKCSAELGVWVSGPIEARVAKAVGLLTCNSVHVCPVCARKLRVRAMKRVSRALAGGLEANKQSFWQMLSVTLRHRNGMPLRWLRDGEMKAWRRCRQDGNVQRIFKRLVKASVRAFEVTHSFVNGWHPHLHIAILTDAWSDEDRDTLDRVWSESVVWALTHVDADNRRKAAKTNEGYHVKIEEHVRALECRPNKENGIKWSKKTLRRGDEGSKLQAYLTDIGLELSLGATKTTSRECSRTPWQIAAAAVEECANAPKKKVPYARLVDGCPCQACSAKRLWWEYERGVKGTRCIELDDRATKYATEFSMCSGATDEAQVGELSFDGAPLVGEAAVYAALDPEMMYVIRTYEKRDARATTMWLEAAANTSGPLTAASIRESVDACIRGMVAVLGLDLASFRPQPGQYFIAPGIFGVWRPGCAA